ncbi:MAG: 6-phosphogluconolactonase [Candidatus Magasanikbacteria bacterium]|nr:6-phosphogluconolactonase [Candidatus Magasanikbacteria bacterium]
MALALKRFSSPTDFVQSSALFIKDVIRKSAPAYLALSGGKTPLPVYEALANDPQFDVEQAEFFLVDERYVPLNNQDSNYVATVKAFSAAEPFFSDHFHWFDTTRSIEGALKAYEQELEQVPAGSFDLLILGLGLDGHTASLFPGGSENLETERRVLHVVNEQAPTPPVRDRLTITWPLILAAKQILVLVTGAEKEALVKELVSGTKPAPEFPPAKLRGHANTSIYYLR